MKTTCESCGQTVRYNAVEGFPEFAPRYCNGCAAEIENDRRKERFVKKIKGWGIPEGDWRFDRKIGNGKMLDWAICHCDKSIWIGGPTGIGKTKSLCRALIEKGWHEPRLSGRYVFSPDWVRETCEMMGRDGEEAERRIAKVKRVDVLILDDLCQGSPTARSAEILFGIIHYRIREGKQLWVTTNATAAEIDEFFGGLKKGPPVRRRLAESCECWKNGG